MSNNDQQQQKGVWAIEYLKIVITLFFKGYKFLTLGFGCEQEKNLGFQGKSVFSYFLLGVFIHDDNGDKKREQRKCSGVYGFDVLMLFSFIWDDYVVMNIDGCWLIVWQGNCQAKNCRWKFRCGVEK
jgi:hypothetical protein